MAVFSFEDRTPRIDPEAFVAPTATVVGDVVIEAGASVWYGAVLRGDVEQIVVRAGANIQECAVVHSSPGNPTEIGANVTVAHLCLVHGAVLGDGCLIANGAIVHDGARIGAGSLVGAGSVVSAGMEVPPGVLVIGSPAAIKKEIVGTGMAALVAENPGAYVDMARRHRESIEEIDAE